MSSSKASSNELIKRIQKQIEERNTKPNKKVLRALQKEIEQTIDELHLIAVELIEKKKTA